MRDVAKEAGVSVMTVSLALKNSPRCALATRERISALAAEMGFVPDPALRALVAYRHQKTTPAFAGTIAYINNSAEPKLTLKQGYHQNLFSGASEMGKHLGYNVEEVWINEPGFNRSRISNILQARGIQGLILGPQVSAHAELNMDWGHFSVVQVGFSLESPRFHTVGADVYFSVFRIMHELCQLGYKKVGLVLRTHQDERVENRYSGAYLAIQHKLPKSFKRLPILRVDRIDGNTFERWFDKYQPDALICGQNKCLEFLKTKGRSVPGDVGYVTPFYSGLDGIAHAHGRQEVTGSKAVEVLSALIDRNEQGIPESRIIHSIEPLWIPGQSVQEVGPPVPLEHTPRWK